MNNWEDYNLYMHYYITQLSLKKSFFVSTDMHGFGIGIPFEGICFHYLWKNNNILTKEEFFNKSTTVDHGNKWEEQGFAQRVTVVKSNADAWRINHNL